MTAESLAEACGLNYRTILQFINGKRNLTIPNLIKIADFLAIPTDVLLDRCSQEQYDNIINNYSSTFMQLRKAPYESYILKRSYKPGSWIEKEEFEFKKVEAPWPNNLLDSIFGEQVEIYVDDEHFAGLEKAISTLTEREQQAIHRYFEEGMTLDRVGASWGVGRERARQILAKALRKLRHPARFQFIRYGVEGGDKQSEIRKLDYEIKKKEAQLKYLTEAIVDKIDEYENTTVPLKPEYYPIIEMIDISLSVRSFNCLRRAGCDTVGDIIKRFEEGNVRCIRNFGRKSAQEVIDILNSKFDCTFKLEEVW